MPAPGRWDSCSHSCSCFAVCPHFILQTSHFCPAFLSLHGLPLLGVRVVRHCPRKPGRQCRGRLCRADRVRGRELALRIAGHRGGRSQWLGKSQLRWSQDVSVCGVGAAAETQLPHTRPGRGPRAAWDSQKGRHTSVLRLSRPLQGLPHKRHGCGTLMQQGMTTRALPARLAPSNGPQRKWLFPSAGCESLRHVVWLRLVRRLLAASCLAHEYDSGRAKRGASGAL